ncbi:MAG: hypothetical protein EXS08_07680 [Planctomycetes bacterium]|nr:hypothetical protein [Planctomycetota bacterium]
MQGSLALSRGTLFVGTHAKTARVQAFDLGGRALAPGFTFRDARRGRSSVSGLAVDEDRGLWIADSPADRVRLFTVFGREVGGLGETDASAGVPLLPGLISDPVDVAVQGHRDQGRIAIACGGERRHAVQLFEPDLSFVQSCAALGSPERLFQGVTRLAAQGELLYAAEALARRVQVFRAGEFLFAFQLTDRQGEPYEPSALAPLGDGRLVVGCRAPRSALFLVDGAGRPQRELAREGEEEGCVDQPCAAVLAPGADERQANLFVMDRDGLRVQVFTLEGRCLGSISPDPASRAERRKKGGR